ncbi:MAG: energy transducer TonB [Syntrophaceae bacterium]
MNYQTRAFQISLLLHIVIITLIIICSTFLDQYKKVVILDFDLLKPVPGVKNVESPTPSIKTNSINPPARQNLKEKEHPRLTEEVHKISPVPEIPPAVKLPETRNLENRSTGLGIPDTVKAVKEGSSGITGGAKEGSGTRLGTGNAAAGKESAKAKYLNKHFAYIRDKILRNVSYPDAARRKGWQGKVLLSFIITADGSARALKIIKSSGFTMLDKSAIAAVKDTAPFPKPPVEAQLVIPIIYHLE